MDTSWYTRSALVFSVALDKIQGAGIQWDTEKTPLSIMGWSVVIAICSKLCWSIQELEEREIWEGSGKKQG